MEDTKFKVGDKVKLNQNIKSFKYGKGGVDYDEVGTVIRVDRENVVINFHSNETWHGLQKELILAELAIDDLQFGDILTLRNGERYVCTDEYMFGEKDDCYRDGDTIKCWYNDDLTQNEGNKQEDIMKVERAGSFIYEREDIREMTVEEISKALGYEVKVVK